MRYDHVWRWKQRLPERHGQRCAVLVRARRMNSIAVEFEDRQRYVTSRYAVRPVRDGEPQQMGLFS